MRPQATAAPVAQLGSLADQVSDVIGVATRNRQSSAPNRSSSGGRSFGGGRSSSGGRSFGGGRSFSGARSAGGRSFSRGSFRATRSGHATRPVSGLRTLHNTRSFGRASGLHAHPGMRGLTHRTSGTLTHKGLGALNNGPGRLHTVPGGLHRGPGIGKGPRGPNFASIHGHPHHLFRDRRWTWWGGSWRVWAPVAALGGFYVGSEYLWPDAYVSAAAPACVGVTDDGCTLRWQSVPFDGGGAEMQCVQFCPRVGVAPPPAIVGAAPQALAPLAAAAPAAGLCELTIFSDRNFAGTPAPTTEDQPRLVDVGWKNQIGSLQIKGGTWDFFTEEDYNGEAMRLPPGQYDNLGDQWTKRIGSFSCVR